MIRVSINGRRHSIFYGWVIVLSGFLNQLLNAGLGFQGFGTYLIPLQHEFGWSKASLAGARSLMQFENGLLGPLEGFLVDRFGPRRIMAIGMLIFGLGLFLFGFIDSLLTYYGVFLIVALGNGLGGFLVMTVAINSWFRRNRTTAMAIAGVGLGVGGIVVIPLLVWTQTTFGWRTAAMASGIAIWLIGIPAALLMRGSPERYGAYQDGDSTPPSGVISRDRHTANVHVPAGTVDFTLKEAIRTPTFWFLGLGQGTAVMVVSAATTHQFAHMEEGIGLSRGSAAAVITVMSALNIGGRLLGGYLGDRLDKRYLAAIGMVGTAAALIILALATSLWSAMLFGVLYGFFWGMRGPMGDSLRGQYFGRAAFGKISGMTAVLSAPGSIFGPIFAGVMADIQGSYITGFIVLACLSAMGCVFFLLARPPDPLARLRIAVPSPKAQA
ncbi:MAG: MFS transporter [Dehalococcoidia bacterium]|nr:MFS transporter [Dehalococcoidia bacterium]